MDGLDIWVNNAGGLPDGTARYMTRTDPEQWQAQIDLNLTAVWKGCVAAAGHMAQGGSIINISSGAARGGQVKNGPYGASMLCRRGRCQHRTSSRVLATRENART